MDETKKAELMSKFEHLVYNTRDIKLIDNVIEELDEMGLLGETNLSKVEHFMVVADQVVSDSPHWPTDDIIALRLRLIGEELVEMLYVLDDEQAIKFSDFIHSQISKARDKIYLNEGAPMQSHIKDQLIHILDTIIDLEYVVLGTYIAFGMQKVAQRGFDIVHDANMNKFISTVTNGHPTINIPALYSKSEGVIAEDPTREYYVKKLNGKVQKPDNWKEPDLSLLI